MLTTSSVVFFHMKKLILTECQLAILEQDFKMATKACDQNGRILIIDIVLNDTNILSLFSR